MKRLVIVTMAVLMGMGSTALAGPWSSAVYASTGSGYFGGYGYGLGGIISEIGLLQIENRKLDIVEKEQTYMHQKPARETQTVNQRLLEDANLRGKIQHLKDENEQLRKENAELKKQLDDMQKQMQEMQKKLDQLIKLAEAKAR